MSEYELPDRDLTEADIAAWQKAKREEWMRDKQLIAEGKLRPEDLSWPHRLGWVGGKIDFSEVEAAIAEDDDATDFND